MNKLRVLVSLFLILFSASPLFGGQDEDGYEEAPTANCNITLDAQGNAVTNVSLYANEIKIDSAAAKAGLTDALRNTLQCDPRDVNLHAWEGGFIFRAQCRLPAHKRNLGMKALIKPDHILRQIRKNGAEEMTISLSVPRLGYNHAPPEMETFNRYDSDIRYQFHVDKERKAVDDFTVEYGYHPSSIIWELAFLAFILIAPLLILLRLRKKILRTADRDPTAAWFGYWRVHRWIAEGIWLVWIIAAVSLRIGTLIDFVFGIDNTLLYVLIFFVPPACVSLLCQYLARPVWLRVRGIDLDRRQMLVKGFWEHVAAIVPLAFVFLGVTSLFLDTGKAMLWFAVALVTKLAGAWMYGKVSRTMPRPLHGGELKERVLDLARQAGVRINQVFVMPAQLYRMGNAFAMRGGNIMITDYLLERLTKRETDCAMAHEIGHVKHRHTILLSWFGFLVTLFVIYAGLYAATEFLPPMLMSFNNDDFNMLGGAIGWINTYLLYPVSLLSAWLIRHFLSRRFERSADEFATLVTGDPESMITLMAKLSKMNLMPVRWGFWDESLGTHPSALRRSEAIAHRHRISPERLRELLEAHPVIENEDGYAVPEEVSNSALIFSTEFKTQKTQILGLILMLSIAGAPLLTGHIINATELPPLTYLAGLIITPFIYLLAVNYTSVLGYGKLKREMKERLSKSGIGLEGNHVYFVGIAPEEYPRTYENHTVWDIGFLIMGEKEIAYFGDKIRFSVPRDNIMSIVKGLRYPGWLDVPETYVRGTTGDNEWVFHLHSLEGRSMTAIARRSKELLLSLIDWHQGRLSGLQSIPVEQQPDLPEFPDLTGIHPRRASTVKGFMTSLIFISLLTFGLASLCGLEDFLAWYGLVMSAWCLFIANLPVSRYREKSLA